jgi:hypothetical protein
MVPSGRRLGFVDVIGTILTRAHGYDRLDLRGRAHRLAFVLPIEHQAITRGASAELGRRGTPAHQAHWCVIAFTSLFRGENPGLPFPKIEASTRVEKRLPGPALKIRSAFRFVFVRRRQLVNSWPWM